MKVESRRILCPRCNLPTIIHSAPEETPDGNFTNDLWAVCPSGHDLTFDEICNAKPMSEEA
jgi:hypothetical protein